MNNYASVLLNITIIFDLYTSVKKPFVDQGNRLKYYFMVQIFLIVAFLIYFRFRMYKTRDSITLSSISDIGLITLFLLQFILMNVFTVLLAIYLCRKGTSKELKGLILKRHLIYYLIFTL